jgi:hypothetical protein
MDGRRTDMNNFSSSFPAICEHEYFAFYFCAAAASSEATFVKPIPD